MSLHEGLTALLTGDAALIALVGARIHWGRQPEIQRVHPYITLTIVSEPQGHTLDGPDGVSGTLVQADAWGESYTSALAAAQAVRARLAGYRGTVAGCVFHGVFGEGGRDLPGDLGDRPIYGISADYRCMWSAA